MHLGWPRENQEVGLVAGKPRVPFHVSPEFKARMKKLQKEIMKKQGEKISYTDLTEKMVASPNFDDLEKQLLNVGEIDIKINLDRRKND